MTRFGLIKEFEPFSEQTKHSIEKFERLRSYTISILEEWSVIHNAAGHTVEILDVVLVYEIDYLK